MTSSSDPVFADIESPKPLHVVLIGAGGREHALAKEIASSSLVVRLTLATGLKESSLAQGMIDHCLTLARERSQQTQKPLEVSVLNFLLHPPFSELFAALGSLESPDLMVIGPEQPLADGLGDAARRAGIAVFGPSQDGARLEASKVFAKELMIAAGVRTARSVAVQSVQDVENAIKENGPAHHFQTPYVLKADGLCAGKGVFILKTQEELIHQARLLFDKRILGDAGSVALIEEFSTGTELSHLVLVNNSNHVAMPPARDHKRLLNGDLGPNTGGMGVVAPVEMQTGLAGQIEEEIVVPVLREIKRRGIDFRGVLYIGLMLTPDGPSVLEFNTRFGDPEAQALLPLFKDSDTFVRTVYRIATAQRLPPASELFVANRHVAVLVLAAKGYPENPVAGAPIEGLTEAGAPQRGNHSVYVLHAGTQKSKDNVWQTRGGRVLNVVATSPQSLDTALDLAHQVASGIRWDGRQMRTDIGRSLSPVSSGAHHPNA